MYQYRFINIITCTTQVISKGNCEAKEASGNLFYSQFFCKLETAQKTIKCPN